VSFRIPPLLTGGARMSASRNAVGVMARSLAWRDLRSRIGEAEYGSGVEPPRTRHEDAQRRHERDDRRTVKGANVVARALGSILEELGVQDAASGQFSFGSSSNWMMTAWAGTLPTEHGVGEGLQGRSLLLVLPDQRLTLSIGHWRLLS